MGKSVKAKNTGDVKDLFGYKETFWCQRPAPKSSGKDNSVAQMRIVAIGLEAESLTAWLKSSESQLSPWQIEAANQALQGREVFFCHSSNGPLWILRPSALSSHRRPFARYRDATAAIFLHEEFRDPKQSCQLITVDLGNEMLQGLLVGFELAAYSFKSPNGERFPVMDFSNTDAAAQLNQAGAIGYAMNAARHLTNLPPNKLNPLTYATAIKERFAKESGFKVDIWDAERLKADGAHLITAVGQGALHPACLVHLSYRKGKSQHRFAVVGKGITFDSGGLDIKPPAGMRNMKKDMAGSAAVVGFAYWLANAQPEVNCDLYLALAENAIDERAFRPGDIITSRAGITVEIHNTDAEGRLVLADALDIAVKQEGKESSPDAIINLATLTGAMRVGLGVEVYGLFSNQDKLAEELLAGAAQLGDKGWRMPLVKEYENELRSTVADCVNASSSGFGGAVTAALFLEKFVGKTPWAHIDMYGWVDRPGGCFTEPGGNGQGVVTLIGYVENLTKK